ncbi:MAG: chloride channel protein [Gammaproteobacteria bacterium]|nr:chloride channel protein [Gammaproteobacteria bacterium]
MKTESAGPSARITLYRMLVLSLIGLAVGCVSSFATIGFVELVHRLNDLLYVSQPSRDQLNGGMLAITTISALTVGGLLVGIILNVGVKSATPLGPADAIYAVQLRKKMPQPIEGVLSTVAAILSLGCGASVGQYAPLVYLGALIGQLTHRLQLGVRDMRSIAIACGVAAAIATAFNAPIAGLIFTHEVILRHYSLRVFTAVTVASVCGFVVANVVFHHPALFLVDFNHAFHAVEFFLFAMEGICCGLLAMVFMKLLEKSQLLAKKIEIYAIFKPMLAGFLVALVGLQIPEVLGAGQAVLRLAAISGSYTAFDLTSILIAKILVTALCIGFGFAGGVIFPSLLIGALFGALFAISVPELLLSEYSGLSVYAICGMMALASPVIGAPLTAVLIIFEITRNYEVTIAAMVTIVFANLVAYRWYGRSLYDTQLSNCGLDLSHGRDRAYLQHRRAAEYITNKIPTVSSEGNCGQLLDQMADSATQSAIVVDTEGNYLGMVFHYQLYAKDINTPVISLVLKPEFEFDENTSLWAAMETMRDYIGEAIPVVHSQTGKYLGALPEAIVISAYLDAVHDLRREEHEA